MLSMCARDIKARASRAQHAAQTQAARARFRSGGGRRRVRCVRRRRLRRFLSALPARAALGVRPGMCVATERAAGMCLATAPAAGTVQV